MPSLDVSDQCLAGFIELLYSIKIMSERVDSEIIDNSLRVSTSGSDLYVVNYKKQTNALADGTVSRLILDDATYTNVGSLNSSRFIVSQHQTAEGTLWSHTGTVLFNNESRRLSNEDYLDALEELVDEEHEFNLSSLYFNNIRLLRHPRSNAHGAVRIYAGEGKLMYNSHFRGNGVDNPIYVGLNAPTNERIGTDRRDEQLLSHLQSYMLALNALVRIVSDRESAFMTSIVRNAKAGDIEYTLGARRAPIENDVVSGPDEDAGATNEQPLFERSVRRISLDDIAGHDHIKEDLRQAIFSFTHPEMMEKWGAERPQAVLFYGPAGTGKSMFAEALASGIGAELIEVNAQDIYDKWIGNSEKNIQLLFDGIEKRTEPTVWLWDEFDGIINGGNGGATTTHNNVAATFKKRLAGLREKNPNILLVATTNNSEALDESVVRAGRFDIKHYVSLPDSEARTQLFANKISDLINELGTEQFNPFSDDINVRELAEQAEDMSGADIVEILRRVRLEKAMDEARTGGQHQITQADLLRHIHAKNRS